MHSYDSYIDHGQWERGFLQGRSATWGIITSLNAGQGHHRLEGLTLNSISFLFPVIKNLDAKHHYEQMSIVE